MLTVEIDDSRLEKSIADKARSIGKSTQEFVKDLLLKALPEEKSELQYKTMSPEENGYLISDIHDNRVMEVEGVYGKNEEVTLFSQVDDAAKYTSELRKNSWRKK